MSQSPCVLCYTIEEKKHKRNGIKILYSANITVTLKLEKRTTKPWTSWKFEGIGEHWCITNIFQEEWGVM